MSARVQDVILTPDASGVIAAQGTSRNTVSSSGMCEGGSTVDASSAVHFNGTLNQDGVLDVTATFEPVAASGTEACRGKGVSSTSSPGPVQFRVNTPGRRYWYFSVGQTLAIPEQLYGSTYVYLYRIE
jgi:hypothetical protein